MFPSKINNSQFSTSLRSCQWYGHFLFYRSNDSSSVTGVTIIVAILLAFVAFVLVSVFVIYSKNLWGFRDKVHQCMFGMYRWKSLFFKIGIRKCLLLKCILVFPFNIPWNNLYLNILNSTNNVTISTCL